MLVMEKPLDSRQFTYTATTEAMPCGRARVVHVMLALVLSLFTAVTLVLANVGLSRRLSAHREFATPAPPLGSLSGQKALDGSEWMPSRGVDQFVVLFVLADAGKDGDIKFWSDVAAVVRALNRNVEFVGLCASGGLCIDSLAASDAFTVLSAMDPTQMHALGRAANQQKVFIYQDGSPLTPLPLREDVAGLSADIARILASKTARREP